MSVARHSFVLYIRSVQLSTIALAIVLSGWSEISASSVRNRTARTARQTTKS